MRIRQDSFNIFSITVNDECKATVLVTHQEQDVAIILVTLLWD